MICIFANLAFVGAHLGFRIHLDSVSPKYMQDDQAHTVSNVTFHAASLGESANLTRADACDLSGDLPAKTVLNYGMTLFGACDALANVTREVTTKRELPVVGGNLTISLRSLMQDDTIPRLTKEMAEDHYHLKDAFNPALIIDVGANVGDFCISAAKMYPQSQVLCAEPAPETFFLLLWNLAENNVPVLELSSLGKTEQPGVIPLRAAFAATDGSVDFAYSPKDSQGANIGGGRSIEDQSPAMGWRHFAVRQYSLGKMLANANVTAIDILKVDCEGCEFTLIPSMQDWITNHTRVKSLVGEIHWPLTHPEKKTLAPQSPPEDISKFEDIMNRRGSPVKQMHHPYPFPPESRTHRRELREGKPLSPEPSETNESSVPIPSRVSQA